MVNTYKLFYYLIAVLYTISMVNSSKPNIVFVLADDFGFNDIGYHGNNHLSQIKTSFLDSLAMSGVRLENYYIQPICTPSRSQLMSGRYQIHTGLQHYVLKPQQPNGLPLENILLPQQLKNCGYDTHMIGKWHLGFYKEEYVPWKRGFDTFYGFLSGREDYFSRYKCDGTYCGYDFHTEKGPTMQTYGKYSAHLFANRISNLLKHHNKSNPLFLYIALQSVHEPLEVPSEYMKEYFFIKNEQRRTYAGMVAAMDEAIKNITKHLQNAGMWDNTLFVFSTDNGGQPRQGGNNWPLRGRKGTLWEGGVRGVGFVHGKMLNVPNPNIFTNNELIHISDWYPTLLSAAQCQMIPGTQSLDGFDQWKTISTYAKSPRTEILHNIDPLFPRKSNEKKVQVQMGFDTSVHAGIRVGDWKLLTGEVGDDRWIKPPESQTVSQIDPSEFNQEEFYPGYQRYDSKSVQLFNIKYDPYERVEVSELYPDIVNELLGKLAKYNATAVPVNFPPDDHRADPKLHGGFWQPWIVDN